LTDLVGPGKLACMARPTGSELEHLQRRFEFLDAQCMSLVTQQTELAKKLRIVEESKRIVEESKRGVVIRMAELRAVAVSADAAKAAGLKIGKWRINLHSTIVGLEDVTRISLNILVPPRCRRTGYGEYYKLPGYISGSTYSWSVTLDPDFIGASEKIRFFFDVQTADGICRAVTLKANLTGTAPIEFLNSDSTPASSAGRGLGIEDVGGKCYNVV
jgi:hypothetical protein